MGIIIYQMVVGATPFKGRTILETYQNIKNNELKFPSMPIDPALKDLITKLLVKESSMRIGAQDI